MKLSLFGDVYLDHRYRVDIEFDSFIFNLEYPLSCKGIPAKDKINLCQDKSYIKDTFGKKPLAVCLANNHIMDYGEEAFQRTINYLESEGIKYFGAGTTKNNFNNPSIVTLNKKTIALLGYSCPSTHPVFGDTHNNGSAKLKDDVVVQDIQRIRSEVDYIIVQLHWGDEEITSPKFQDVVKARLFVDSGADLIIGHHAHVIQSYEIYKGKHIYYGLGNFIFPDLDTNSKFDGKNFTGRYIKKQTNKNRQSIVVEIDTRLKNTEFVTGFKNNRVYRKKIRISNFIPKTDKEYQRILKKERRVMAFKNFLTEPKIPTISQFVRFAKGYS